MRFLLILFIALQYFTVSSCMGNNLKKILSDLPFKTGDISVPVFPKDTLSIEKFGAVRDSNFINTEAVNRAIKACNKNGGGVVVVPRGIWQTGPVQLASNVNLHLESGAVLIFSTKIEDYPLIVSSWEGKEAVRRISPVYGKNLTNVAITGHGIIDGAGDAWRPVKKFKLSSREWDNLVASGGVVSDDGDIWWPSEAAMNGASLVQKLQKENAPIEAYEATREYLRPVLINLVKCHNVLLDGPTFQNSPAWNIHPLLCENVVIRNINVSNPWYSQNGDGIDIESCRNVLLYNSTFDVGDDAICLKSGKDEFGRKRGVPSENIVVDNCTVYHGHGGFTVGSEMSGSIRNILVRNCTFLGTDVGLRFKSTRGRGGIVENIYLDNIRMKDIRAEAIRFNMFYDNQPPIPEPGQDASGEPQEGDVPTAVTEGTPIFRNIHISDIYCLNAGQAVFLQGLPEMHLKNLSIKNVLITSQQGLTCVDSDEITFHNLRIVPSRGPLMTFFNSRDVVIDKINISGKQLPVIVINGEESKNIRIKKAVGNIDSKTVLLGDEVPPDVLTW